MNILIVAKQSKIEWEQQKFGIGPEEIKQKYTAEHANLKNILESHEKQLAVRQTFKQVFNNTDMVIMASSDFEMAIRKQYNLIISLGGDNCFTYVSNHLPNTPILGINSDPQRSVGCLTQYAVHTDKDIYDLSEKIDDRRYRIEEWTRLVAEVDGKVITQATSEYFLGERQRVDMSRHILIYRGREVEQKCSGLLIATGAGSSGWLRSCGGDYVWPCSAKYVCFKATEIYSEEKRASSGILSEGEELIVHSLNDNEGIISADSFDTYAFNRGSSAKIRIGNPLRVMVPK